MQYQNKQPRGANAPSGCLEELQGAQRALMANQANQTWAANIKQWLNSVSFKQYKQYKQAVQYGIVERRSRHKRTPAPAIMPKHPQKQRKSTSKEQRKRQHAYNQPN